MREKVFTYCITAQCLTPIKGIFEIDKYSGIATILTAANSLQEAAEAAVYEIVELYERKGYDITINHTQLAITIREDDHIINHFWNFRGHRI